MTHTTVIPSSKNVASSPKDHLQSSPKWIKCNRNSVTVWKPRTAGLTGCPLFDYCRVQRAIFSHKVRYTGCHFPPSLVYCSLHILSSLTKATEQGFNMFKRCKGTAKTLGAACQITFLMASLSGCLVSLEKKGQVGRANPFSPLSQRNHSLSRLSLWCLCFLFLPLFNPFFKVHPAYIQHGGNDFVGNETRVKKKRQAERQKEWNGRGGQTKKERKRVGERERVSKPGVVLILAVLWACQSSISTLSELLR